MNPRAMPCMFQSSEVPTVTRSSAAHCSSWATSLTLTRDRISDVAVRPEHSKY